MDISKKIVDNTNKFDLAEILDFKSKVKNCVWLDCAILENNNKSKTLFAPQPGYAVYFEVNNEDIIDVVPAGYSVDHLDVSYKMVKLFIKENSLLMRQTHHYANQIVDYLLELKQIAEYKKSRIASKTNEERQNVQSQPGNGGGEPKPTPEPRPKEPVGSNVRG